MNEIYKSLIKAQSEFPKIQKNCVNPMFKSRYADLETILAAVRPVLNKYGIYLRQIVTNSDNAICVETILSHESGEEISSGVLSVPVNMGKGIGAQAVGSAITYGKRYSLSAFLGISADDDDDGNEAQIRPAQKMSAPAKKPAPQAAPKPAPVKQPTPADIDDDNAIGERELVAEFKARIVECESEPELKELGAEIGVTPMSDSAKQEVRTVYKNKLKEFKNI